MSKNIREIPLTEMVERIHELARIREEVSKKVRGVVNDIYVRDIPRKEDWSFLIATSSLTFIQEYTTGNATINTSGSTVTFSSTVTVDSTMIGRKIKFASNDYVYNVSGLSSSTGITISPPLSGTQNISGQSYSMFQPIYALAGDFERFPKNGGLHIFQGGQKKTVMEQSYQHYVDNFIPSANDNTDFCRLVGNDTAGNRLIEVVPPPKNALSAEYDYYRQVYPMRETTSGLIGNISASGTSVIGDSNTRFTEARTGDYFRINNFGTGSDSEWYRIIAISGNSGLTLQTAFGLSGATSAGYTICSSPDIPTMIHPGVMYGALAAILADQDDPMALAYKQEYANVLTDGKRIYKTRTYNKEIATIAEDYQYRR